MTYNALAQGELGIRSSSTESGFSELPQLPAHGTSSYVALQPLRTDFGHSTESRPADEPAVGKDFIESPSITRMKSMINSMLPAGASYETVEDDDYEHETTSNGHLSAHSYSDAHDGATGVDLLTREHSAAGRSNPHSAHTSFRTVSREGSIPMRHPTPDLQSLQGAYVTNVERLERSAERLSLSSDIGEELRKMKLEQKRSDSRRSSILNGRSEDGGSFTPARRQFSWASNASRSIQGLYEATRSGAVAAGGYVSSPHSGSWSHYSARDRSFSRGSRLTQVSEPADEDQDFHYPADSIQSVPIIARPRPSQVFRVINDDGSPLEPTAVDWISHDVPPAPPTPEHTGGDQDHQEPTERPASASTTRRTTNPFADFDGVHILSNSQDPSENGDREADSATTRRIPASRPQSYADISTHENMIFYPAPVPMMINLPQRLSKLPSATQQAKRNSHLPRFGAVEAVKSTTGLPGLPESGSEGLLENPWQDQPKGTIDHRKSTANLPSQLRASAFFDHQPLRQEVEVKGHSAVDTLESILEASASAPVSVFVDHPIAGRLGGDIYSNSSARKSTGNLISDNREHRKSKNSAYLLNRRDSIPDVLNRDMIADEGPVDMRTRSTTRHSSAPTLPDLENFGDIRVAGIEDEQAPFKGLEEEHELDKPADEEGIFYDAKEGFAEDDLSEDSMQEPQYHGAPTTLLAELQLRKAQQKQRNRNAVTAFPNGMHSTLLQLDAVAQVQKQSRRQKHITLAWEDPSTQQASIENEDEDIPLGVLYPGRKVVSDEKGGHFDDDIPLGLIQKREIDDNEPLSQRRARLRGEDPAPRRLSPGRRESAYTLDLPGLVESGSKVDEEEGETLAQRRKRLNGQSKGDENPPPRPISSDFASEVLSQLGGFSEEPKKKATTAAIPTKTPDLEKEETLGQRRKRLQSERRSTVREAGSGQQEQELNTGSQTLASKSNHHEPNGFRTHNQSTSHFPAGFAHPDQSRGFSIPQPSTYGHQNNAHLHLNGLAEYNQHTRFMNQDQGAPMFPVGQDGMYDKKQRDVVNRWRQSVMY